MADERASAASGSGEERRIRLTKDQINALPLIQYEGPVHFVTRPEEVRRALETLGSQPVLGFDTETRPTFRSGQYHPPALLQLASPDCAYVFRLSTLPLGDGIIRLLASPDILKVGVAPQRDIRELKEVVPFEEAGVVDVATLARGCGIDAGGLRSLAAAVLGWRISKRYQTSNWGRRHLHPAQIRYAATDAWVSLQIYLALVGKRRADEDGARQSHPRAG